MKANALIRSNFNVDPDELQMSKWAELYAQADWLEKWRLKNQAELFQMLFSDSS